MSMKLYVGNLSFNATAQDLTELFSEFGSVESANVIEDRETGRSRGFAFVEMSSSEEGKAAIEQVNGREVDGRQLKVNEAKPREDRPRTGGVQAVHRRVRCPRGPGRFFYPPQSEPGFSQELAFRSTIHPTSEGRGGASSWGFSRREAEASLQPGRLLGIEREGRFEKWVHGVET